MFQTFVISAWDFDSVLRTPDFLTIYSVSVQLWQLYYDLYINSFWWICFYINEKRFFFFCGSRVLGFCVVPPPP